MEALSDEEKNKLIFEAELFFSEGVLLKSEFLKIKKKLKKKK